MRLTGLASDLRMAWWSPNLTARCWGVIFFLGFKKAAFIKAINSISLTCSKLKCFLKKSTLESTFGGGEKDFDGTYISSVIVHFF